MFNSYRENTSSEKEAGASTGRRVQPGVVKMGFLVVACTVRVGVAAAPRGGEQDELVKCDPWQTRRNQF